MKFMLPITVVDANTFTVVNATVILSAPVTGTGTLETRSAIAQAGTIFRLVPTVAATGTAKRMFSPAAVTTKAFSGGNLVTLTAANHGFPIGSTVDVNLGDPAFDTTGATITVVNANSFTYAKTYSVSIINKVSDAVNFTLTTAAEHKLRTGDTVSFTTVDAAINGQTLTVTVVNPTTFRVTDPATTVVGSTAVTGTGTLQTGGPTATSAPNNVAALNTVPTTAAGVSATVSFGGGANRLARLKPSGAMDAVFAANLGTGLSATVKALTINGSGQIVLGGSYTGTSFSAGVATKGLANNVATIVTAVPHGFSSTHQVTIAGVDADFDTPAIISVLDATTFTYPRTFSSTITMKQMVGSTATLTTAVAHTFLVGQTVVVSIGDANFDGTYVLGVGTGGSSLVYTAAGTPPTVNPAVATAGTVNRLIATVAATGTASLTAGANQLARVSSLGTFDAEFSRVFNGVAGATATINSLVL
ncbi:MAG: hypothetical protein AAB214_12785, partial [Fibrobacterota bacterium]